MDNVDDLSIDADWLQHFVSYARFRYNVEPRSSLASVTWLASAAKRGDFARLRHCLAAGANITEPDTQSKTPLVHARHHITVEMMYYIRCVHAGIVRALTRSLGRTPTQMEIYGASTHKKARKFRFYVKRQVDAVCAKFMEAVGKGDLEAVRSMVENNEISVNAVKKSTLETALSVALASRQKHVAIYLVRNGADVHDVCCVNEDTHLSTLLTAIRTGDVYLVREIAARGGLVSAQWYYVRCPLAEAARTGSCEMVELLLKLGVHSKLFAFSLPWPIHSVLNSMKGSTERETDLWLLLCVAYWLHDKPLFEFLRRTHTELQHLEANAANMVVLLILAVYQEDDDLVAELLERGVNVNHNVGIHAVVAAVAVNSTRMLRLLLDRRAVVSINYYRIIPNSASSRLLTIAVYANAMDCVQMLLPLETRPLCREEAMQEAAKQGYVELVELLIDDSTMPSSETELECCLQFTKCPLVLDLFLTRWCPSKYPISALHGLFKRLCSENNSPELLSVYIAHGLDITHDAIDDTNTTSPLMQGVIWGSNRLPALPVVKLLLGHGVPCVTLRDGKTPEQDMNDQTRYQGNANFNKLFGRCRDLLTAHSS